MAAEAPQAGGKGGAKDPEAGDEQALREFVRIATGTDGPPPSALWRAWSVAKFVVACLLLLPLRIIFLSLTVSCIWLLYKLSACCGPSRKAAEDLAPHNRVERALLRAIAPLWRLVLFLFGVVWISVRRVGGASSPSPGKSGSAARNATIVANHVSTMDGPVLAGLKGCLLTGVAIRWVCKMPGTSAVAKGHHILPVGRAPASADAGKVAPAESPAKTATDTIAEYQRACAADPRLLTLVVFPEGTTKASRCLVKFRSGAFVSGEPVQPVCLRYPDHFAWTDSLLAHLFTLLTSWLTRVEVIVLPLYEPSPEEKANPSLYARNVQAAMAEALNLPPERSSTAVGAKELQEMKQK